jgi:hypothetical protein
MFEAILAGSQSSLLLTWSLPELPNQRKVLRRRKKEKDVRDMDLKIENVGKRRECE